MPRNIKETRIELKRWGNFWRSREYGNGYASVSPTARICETLRSECFTQGTSHLISHLSDNMHEPDDIRAISEIVNRLSNQCRLALVRKYVKKTAETGYYIDEAERLVMLAL